MTDYTEQEMDQNAAQYEFRSWEDLTPLEKCREAYSDMFKDVYGFRPRGQDFGWTLEQYEEEFEYLDRALELRLKEEAEEQNVAVAAFEARVDEVIKLGAGDRETALRWIMDGSEAGGDWEYFCFLTSLPYGYFKKG
jgi:phage baseplate assembly protein W